MSFGVRIHKRVHPLSHMRRLQQEGKQLQGIINMFGMQVGGILFSKVAEKIMAFS